MASAATIRATLEDLYREEGKAELIGGRIVRYMATGDLPSDVTNEIYVSLRMNAKKTKQGVAKADGIGYAIPESPGRNRHGLPCRESRSA